MANEIKVRVAVALFKDGKVLLIKDSRFEEPMYYLPGGALEHGETFSQACIRELKEETNLDIEVKDLLYLRDFIKDGKHVVDTFFLGEIKSGEMTNKFDPDRGIKDFDLVWADIKELKQFNFFPIYLKEQLAKDYEVKFKGGAKYIGACK